MKKVFGLLVLLMLLATPVMADYSHYPIRYVFRFYNPTTGEHLFTTSDIEAQNLALNRWWQEGDSWMAIEGFGMPVYRLYNAVLDDHLYTSSQEEVNMLLQNGWVADFNMVPAFYSLGKTPIYRLYNPRTGRHLLTVNEGEYNVLASQSDWNPEGVAFYGVEPMINPNINHQSQGFYGGVGRPDVLVDENGQIPDGIYSVIINSESN